jgi:glutamine amidotransferase-like uncharacterized protein
MRHFSLLYTIVISLVVTHSAFATRRPVQLPDPAVLREAMERNTESRSHPRVTEEGASEPDRAIFGQPKKLIALYSGDGAWKLGLRHWKKFLKRYRFSYQTVSPNDILSGALTHDRFSAIVMPGGKSWIYLEDLGVEGGEKIRQFVEAGGGYFGICAGAFYATSFRQGGRATGSYGIGLLDGIAFDGTALNVNPFKDGTSWYPFFLEGFQSQYKILLLGGPSFRYSEYEAQEKQIEVVSRFRVINEPSVIALKYGEGRVILSGPHPEVDERRTIWGWFFRTDPDSEWPWMAAYMRYITDQGPKPVVKK